MVARIRAAAVVLAMSSFVFWASLAKPSAQGPTTAGVAAPTAQTGQAAAAAPAGRVDVGATIYRKVGCFQCHVNEAQGGANGPKLGPDPIPFARFTQYVRRPTGDMPPYSEKVPVRAGHGRHLRLRACATTAAGSQRDPVARAVGSGLWRWGKSAQASLR